MAFDTKDADLKQGIRGIFSVMILLILSFFLGFFCYSNSASAITTSSLGGSLKGDPAVIQNMDGRLEVFAVNPGNQLYHIWQTSPGNNSWSSFSSLGGSINSNPAVIRNADGRLEVFVIGSNKQLYHVWQKWLGNNSWSSFSSLGGSLKGDPKVIQNADGRLEVFAVNPGNQLYHIWQTSPGINSWSSFSSLGGSINSNPAVIRNADGRLEVFGVGSNNQLYHTWQISPGDNSWSSFSSLGRFIKSDPKVIQNADGRLEVFGVGSNNQLSHTSQISPGNISWSSFSSLGGSINGNPALIRNDDGRIGVFVVNPGNQLYYISQTAAGYDDWSPFGLLTGNVKGNPAVIRNEDGTAGVFVIGNDNSLWHVKLSTTDITNSQPQAVAGKIKHSNISAVPVYKGLAFPSTMAFLGPEDLLILEKNSGNVQRITNFNTSTTLTTVNVSSAAERGLVGVATSRNQSTNVQNVFLYFTESNKTNDRSNDVSNKLYRYELKNNSLANATLILSIKNPLYPYHNGGAITIGPDNLLYVPVGDTGHNDSLAQNIPNGKLPDGRGGILRFTLDGKPAGVFKTSNLYYAYGIRNSFGLAFDPVTGKLWDTENGPTYGDEVNLVEPGFNSGWSQVAGKWKMAQSKSLSGGERSAGKNFTDRGDLISLEGKGQYSDPELTWFHTIGVTGLLFLNTDKYGNENKNDVLIADFQGRIYKLDLNLNRTSFVLNDSLSDKIVDDEIQNEKLVFGTGFGGITDMKLGPDGYIYVLTASDMGLESPLHNGVIYKLIPR